MTYFWMGFYGMLGVTWAWVVCWLFVLAVAGFAAIVIAIYDTVRR